jgi:hypothetical protein
MSKNRTQMIEISSKHRLSGSFNDFRINLNHDNLRPYDYRQKIIVSPILCIVPRTWSGINNYNDHFKIIIDNYPHEIKLIQGNFNVISLLNQLEEIFIKLMPSSIIGYDNNRNKFLFNSPDDNKNYKMDFTNTDAYFLLGFNKNDIIDFSFSPEYLAVLSKNPINMNAEQTIKIHSNIPLIANNCVSNNTDEFNNDFKQTTTLLQYPIMASPFDNCIFTAHNYENIIHTLSHSNIEDVHIWVTDNLNRKLLIQQDWTITLRVTYIAFDDEQIQKEVLEIKNFVKYLVLEKTTKKRAKK